jgi:ParB-like chromosome segregation protein Spo0J
MVDIAYEPARPIGTLIEDKANPRIHSQAEIDEMAASITRFGMPSPVIAGADGVVIAGHRRLRAARKLGWPAVPVMVVTGLSPAELKALGLADNRMAANGGWDEQLIRNALEAIKGEGEAIQGLGFAQKELDALLSDGDQIKVKEVEVSPVQDRFWISVRGPIAGQAAMLAALRTAAAELDGVEVELGTIRQG